MATYYVSSEASNGYVVGDDSNNGTSKTTPWLTLDPINDVGFTWSGDDTVRINGDTSVTAELTLDNNITIIGEGTRPTITPQTGGGNYGIQFTDGKTATLQNLTIPYGSCATALFFFSAQTSQQTVTFTDCAIDATGGRLVAQSTNNLIDCTFDSCDVTGTSLTDNCIDFERMGAASSLTVTGCTVTASHNTTSERSAVRVVATGAGVALTVQNATIKSSNIHATSGVLYGIRGTECAAALIDGNTITTTNGAASRTCYGVLLDGVTQTVTSGQVSNNRVTVNTNLGVLIQIGEEATASTVNSYAVYGNDCVGPTTATSLHGIMCGWNSGCSVYNNRVRYAGIGYLDDTGTDNIFSHNVSEHVPTGQMHLRCKGSTRAVFAGNLCIIAGAYNGDAIYLDANTEGPTNSTDCIFAGNAVYVTPGATDPSYLVQLLASQTAKFYGNNYYFGSGTFLADMFNDGGTDRTLATWNAQAHVYGEHSAQFTPRLMVRPNHRLLTPTKWVR